jgi:hypothetical protein
MTPQVRASAYSLEIEDPRTGATTFESHMSLAAVVTRAEMLIEAGYNIGIWSAASVEQRPRHAVAANDDVWLGALDKRLTG